MKPFRPPMDCEPLINLIRATLPIYSELRLGGLNVEVVDDGLKRFKQLEGVRAIITPNHSHRDDPASMMLLARLAGENFNFIAAREVFDWGPFGLHGLWLQSMGTGSVTRGATDLSSIRCFTDLVYANKKKLVLFPEGEISKRNGELIKLEAGAAYIGFRVVEKVRASKTPNAPVVILPTALMYTFEQDVRESLKDTLSTLEQRLEMNAATNSMRGRLTALAEKVRDILLEEYEYAAPKGLDLVQSIDFLRKTILQNVAGYLKVNVDDLDTDQKQLAAARVLRNKLDDYILAEIAKCSDYQKAIHSEKIEKIQDFYKDLDRVVNVIGIKDGYLTERMTQERFDDVLSCLENEVSHQITIHGRRKVLMGIGTPINLQNFYPTSPKGKKLAMENVDNEMASQMQSMLDQLDRRRKQQVLVD